MVEELVNPYIAGAPVTEARMFFGREDVFQWIETSLSGRYADHILVIHGQRRVGKTSVLKQLGNRLPKRYIPVFFDLQGRTHTTLDRFLWWLAREIVRVLKQERGIEVPLPEKDAFSADLEYFENQFLSGLHSALGGSTLLLTFDEFDNLEESEIKEILGRPLIDYLRRLMGSPDLNFIFSIGSSGRKLENMQASYTEFFKTALYKKISFLDEEQTHYLITRPVEGVLQYDKPAVNHIYRITGGHPYFTQLTCHELFARCQRTDQRHIREPDVEAVLEDVVERGTVNLKFVWDEASDIEKWSLAALAAMDGKSDNRTLADFLHKQQVRFSESELTSGLLHLREKDVLTPENRFVIHLLKLWLQKNRPIEQVREELTEVNPIANRYIEIGLEFKNSRQYEKAIESFQQALAVSPANVQAQVSIALVYMDQKAYDKAVGEFEKALAIDDEDVAARSGLCEAHLALGDAAMQKGRLKEAGQSYQRVLAMNEEHTEARGRMAEINRQRAEKALADGRDEEAVNAFLDALKYTPEDEKLARRLEAVKAEKKAKIVAAQIARSEKEASARNWEAAIRTLEEANQLAPEDPDVKKRLEHVRGKLRENKLAALKTKAQTALKAERFGEAQKTWQEYLSLEPADREQAEAEVSKLNELVELERTYNEAQQAFTEKQFDKAISLIKQVIVRDENFKDASRLLTQAIELRRSTRPARLAFPVGKLLRGMLATLTIAGIGIGAYFAWNQWGANIAGLFSDGSKVEKVCFLMTGMDDARSHWNSEISQALTDVANAYQLESKSFLTRMIKEEYEAQLTKMIQTEKCDLILGSGIWLKDTFYEFAKTYPNVKFSLIDVDYGTIPRPLPKNLIEQVFAAYDSGYMAGYLAAGLTKTGRVGTFGAEEDNQYVYEYMKGFVKGVEDYNGRHGTQVQASGFNIADGSGLFAGGYGSDNVNRELHSIRAEHLIGTENVDVLFIASSPDASENALGSVFESNQNNGTEIKVIGTDLDWAAYYAPAQSPWAGLCITSATKDFESMVKAIISRAVEDPDNGETIEGNGSNQGVGLAPFNESVFAIPGEIKSELAQLQQEMFGVTSLATPITTSTLDSAIQAALDTIKNEAPVYQTSFDAWDFGDPQSDAKVENGKLIVTSENQQHAGAGLYNLISDKYAVQFDLRVLDISPEGHCIFETSNDTDSGTSSWRAISAGFSSNGSAWLAHYIHPDRFEDFGGAIGKYDVSKSNAVTLIFLGDRIAAFIDGNLAYTAIDPDGSTVYNHQALSANFTAQCEYDNFKIWDLSEVDFSAIQTALDTIKNEAPTYQTSFDVWDTGWYSRGDARVENAKMILTSRNQEGVTVGISNLASDRYAVEFDVTIEGSPEGICVFESMNQETGKYWKGMSAIFASNGQAEFIRSVDLETDTHESIALSHFDATRTNAVVLIILGDQIATFINGQIAFTAINPNGSVVYAQQQLSGYGTTGCEFDNYKIWDLRGLDPATLTALAAIQNEAPIYQTSFDSWDTEWYSRGDARVENGKLIIAAETQDGGTVNISNLSSDRFAVEFEFRRLATIPDGECNFGTFNDGVEKSWMAISAVFFSNGQAVLARSVNVDTVNNIAESNYDETKVNTITWIILGDKITAFINGQIAYTALNPNGSVVYVAQELSAYNTIGCEFDNYKIWDLSGVDFNP